MHSLLHGIFLIQGFSPGFLIAGQSFIIWATREALQLKKKKGQNERNWKVNLLMWGKAVCRVEWDWQGAEERLLIWYPFGLGILLLFYYSKSPTCEPFTCKLSKMWMCICMSNHLLVHASGWHCHMCASSTNGCVFVYFTAQYYIEYSIFISSPRCLKTSVKVMI